MTEIVEINVKTKILIIEEIKIRKDLLKMFIHQKSSKINKINVKISDIQITNKNVQIIKNFPDLRNKTPNRKKRIKITNIRSRRKIGKEW